MFRRKACDYSLNVLIVAQYFPPDLGGSATRAYNVARGLVLNGCKVTVVAAVPHYPQGKIPKEYLWKPVKVEQMGAVRVIRTFMPPLESRGLIRRVLLLGVFAVTSLFALPLVGRIDVVWASSWVPGIAYGRIRKRPVVLNVDDLTLEDLQGLEMMEKDSLVLRVATLVYRLLYLKADAITPISPGYIEIISKKYSVEETRIHVVKGGVDLDLFKPSRSQNKHSGMFTVLYSGAFSVGYDFDQIFNAARVIETKDDAVEFVLQGKGERVNHLKSRIREMNVKNVKIVDKLLSRGEVADLLSQADALILPLADYGRPYLGLSSKLYEYQAVGKPIICCGNGSPADYLTETNSGIVVKPGDFTGLAQAVLYLHHNRKVAKQLGEAGQRFVKENLSIEKVGSKMMAVFEQVGLVANRSNK